jgi:hypothetical protein
MESNNMILNNDLQSACGKQILQFFEKNVWILALSYGDLGDEKGAEILKI